MILNLSPYPSYRNTKVKWLECVPEHWGMRRLKSVCLQSALYGANVSAGSYSNKGVRFLRTTDIAEDGELNPSGVYLPENLVRDYLLADGDLLISRSGTVGRSFLFDAKRHGQCAYAGYLVRFVPSREILPKYLFWFTKTQAFYEFLRVVAISSTIENVNGEKYANAPLPIPLLTEQHRIVRLLDHADRRIQRYIRAKQKLITLLEEQKQVIIHQAVTGQIDVSTGQPYPAYKRSGVEWLEKVPAHWQFLALRRRWRVIDCKHLTVPFVDDGIPLASVREAQSFELSLKRSNHTTPEWYGKLIEGEREPRLGDLIYCRNVSVGAAALVTTQSRFAMGQDVCLIRSSSENQRWLNYFLHSRVMSDQLALILVGSTFNRINVADIKGLLIAVPSESEQDQIASFLDDELSKIDAAIRICHREPALLREFRTRLIADVVTGRLNVREAAAELPDDDYQDGAEESAYEQTIDQEMIV